MWIFNYRACTVLIFMVLNILIGTEVRAIRRLCLKNKITREGQVRPFDVFYDFIEDSGSSDNPLDPEIGYDTDCNYLEPLELVRNTSTGSQSAAGVIDNKFFFNIFNLPWFNKKTTKAPIATTKKPTAVTKPIFGSHPITPAVILKPSGISKPVTNYSGDISKPVTLSSLEQLIGFSLTKPTVSPEQTDNNSTDNDSSSSTAPETTEKNK